MNMYTHRHQTYTHTHSPTKHANYRELWKGVGRGATGMSVKCYPGVCGLEADHIRLIKKNFRCKFALKWTSWHVIAVDKWQEFVLSQPSSQGISIAKNLQRSWALFQICRSSLSILNVYLIFTRAYNMFGSIPPFTPYLSVPPLFFPILFLTSPHVLWLLNVIPTESMQCCLYVHGCGTTHQNMNSILGPLSWRNWLFLLAVINCQWLLSWG